MRASCRCATVAIAVGAMLRCDGSRSTEPQPSEPFAQKLPGSCFGVVVEAADEGVALLGNLCFGSLEEQRLSGSWGLGA